MLTANIYPAHEKQIWKAYWALKNHAEMSFVQVPGKIDLFLVRAAAAEGNIEKRDKVALFEVEIEDQKFLICKM